MKNESRFLIKTNTESYSEFCADFEYLIIFQKYFSGENRSSIIFRLLRVIRGEKLLLSL